MKKITIRLSDKAQGFVEAKAEELQKTESEIINTMLENRAAVEKMNAAKQAKKESLTD